MRPKELAEDPIDEWLAKEDPESVKYKKKCPHCATICEVSGIQEYSTIETKRYLGKGLSADDPVWMAQCIKRDQNESCLFQIASIIFECSMLSELLEESFLG